MNAANKSDRPQKIKKKKYNFYGLNIKVRSETRSGADMYKEIFQRLYDSAGKISISKDKGMAVKSREVQVVESNGKESSVITGSIVRFVILEDHGWYNDDKRIIQEIDIPSEMHPGTTEVEYVFIPDTHRFYFLSNSKISITQMITFLKSAIEKVINENEDFDISVITEQDLITRILNAQSLKSLKIHVSYTNDDLEKESIALMDSLVKATQTNSVDLTFKSKKELPLNQKSQMIEGLVGLAKENGSAEATIVEANKTITVKTNDYPAKIGISRPKNETFLSVARALAKEIINKYRHG